MLQSWVGYRKNRVHFVYKLDNLFRSIRVSDENSSITKGFQFFKQILNQDFFRMHHSKPHHQFSTLFWLHLLFSMHLMNCFEPNDPEVKKHHKWTLKWLKLGVVSSFDPHSMCKKLRGLRKKNGCNSCTKWTIYFEVIGFHTKNRLLQKDFNFFNLFQLQTFCAFNMNH